MGFTFDTHGDNQIASDSGHYSWAYDGNGNPITYLSKTNAFDPENRMTAYAIPTGGGHASLTMGYDDAGMRAWKENSSSTRTYFLYDGSDLLAELTSAGALGTYQTVGADGVVSRRAGITTTYFAFDPSGSVSAVLNYTGTVHGNEMFEANGHRDGSYSDRPVDFGGQWGYYGDGETGLTLLGHRYYDSYAGRFLTRDPIGYNGGVNLYGYTTNNYENESDPNGLNPTTSAFRSGEFVNNSSHPISTVFDGSPDGKHRVEYIMTIPPGYQSVPSNVDIDDVKLSDGNWEHIKGRIFGANIACATDISGGYSVGVGLGFLGHDSPLAPDKSGWPQYFGKDPKVAIDFRQALADGFVEPIPAPAPASVSPNSGNIYNQPVGLDGSISRYN